MARLNQDRRSSTLDSLYRGRTPVEGTNSDKENQMPETQDSSMGPPRAPLAVHPSKRRRIETTRDQTPMAQFLTQNPKKTDEDESTRWYDPNQPEEERRLLRMEMYRVGREVADRREDMIHGDVEGALKYVAHQNELMDRVRQPADAIVDSRTMLTLSETAKKRTAQAASRSTQVRIDPNKFMTRLMRFMGQNQGPGNVQDDDDSEVETDLDLNWNALGDLAFAGSRRPAVPSFLLGPLSVEKRVRVTQRSARQRREAPAAPSRPEELKPEDLEKNETSQITVLCEKIKHRLTSLLDQGVQGVEAEEDTIVTEKDARKLFRKYHLSTNYEVSLIEFVINPHSFAQTIENLFHVSFLVKDGFFLVSQDHDGLPTLRIVQPSGRDEEAGQNISRHQSIMSLDQKLWKHFIKVFDIKESLIPHREESHTQVTSRGWYG